MEEIVRVVRTLEYVGPRSVVEYQLERRYIIDTFAIGQLTIKETVSPTEVVSDPS